MKSIKNIFVAALIIPSAIVSAQSVNTGAYKGEDFSLEGALAMLKQSKSPEDFEKLLNLEDNNINNLDLDNDGETDYITVTDLKQGNTHVLVLSTFINENQKQDIATIGIEKTGAANAVLQIKGDEDLYASNTVIEPGDVKTIIEKGKGPDAGVADVAAITVNVWLWPAVQFIYAPAYVVYTSPWHRRAYPTWYHSWRPVHHTVFYTHCAPYRMHYYPAPAPRVVMANRVYAPYRNTVIVCSGPQYRHIYPHAPYRGGSSAVIHRNGQTTRIMNTRNGATHTIITRGVQNNQRAVMNHGYRRRP